MNIRTRISEEKRLNAYHDRVDSIRKGGEKVKTVENETTEKAADILEKSEETKTLQEIPGFTGNLEALEKSGLEAFDLGEPTCSEIIKNPKEASETEPQAWENEGKWYYNEPGALAEAKYLGKTLPDWKKICKPYGNDGERMAKELGLSFAGHRYWTTGYYYNQSVNASYWSSSPTTSSAFHLTFNTSNISHTTVNTRAYGFSVRCLKN